MLVMLLCFVVFIGLAKMGAVVRIIVVGGLISGALEHRFKLLAASKFISSTGFPM